MSGDCGGKFSLDKAHGDHLDKLDFFGFGAIQEKYGADGNLIDDKIVLSKKVLRELGESDADGPLKY